MLCSGNVRSLTLVPLEHTSIYELHASVAVLCCKNVLIEAPLFEGKPTHGENEGPKQRPCCLGHLPYP